MTDRREAATERVCVCNKEIERLCVFCLCAHVMDRAWLAVIQGP